MVDLSGTRLVLPKWNTQAPVTARGTRVVVAEPPQQRIIAYLNAAKGASIEQYSEYTISLPWVYYWLIGTQASKRWYLTNIIGALEEVVEFQPGAFVSLPLPNVHIGNGIPCFHEMRTTIPAVITDFWQMGFNNDMSDAWCRCEPSFTGERRKSRVEPHSYLQAWGAVPPERLSEYDWPVVDWVLLPWRPTTSGVPPHGPPHGN